MDFGAIVALLGSGTGALSGAVSAAEGLKNLLSKPDTDTLEAKKLIATMYDELIKARGFQLALQDELEKIRSDVERVNRFANRSVNYRLEATPLGPLLYRYIGGSEGSTPDHYVCPRCFEAQEISILQPKGLNVFCPSCGAEFRFKPAPDVNLNPRGGTWGRR